MRKNGEAAGRSSGWGIAVATVVALCSVGLAVSAILDASAARARSAAVADLRVAALSLASADALAAAGGQPDLGVVAVSVAAIAPENRDALAILPPADMAEADRLLDEISGCGNWLLEPTGDQPHLHEHERALDLLATASGLGSDQAAAATREALGALALALASALVAAALVARRANRWRRESLVSKAETSVGQRITAVLDDWPDGFLIAAPDGSLLYRSPSAAAFLHDRADHLDHLVAAASVEQATRLREHLCTGEQQRGSVFELESPAGTMASVDVRVSDLVSDPLVKGRVIVLRDMTAEVALRSELRHQAETDPLTGLPNRRALGAVLERCRRANESTAMILIDVDGFKAVNDLLGHVAGDELLTQIAARLREECADASVIRLGGDEFALVVTSDDALLELEAKATKLLDRAAQPYAIDGRHEPVRVSLGVAVVGPEELDDLVRRADTAMYVAKRRGGGGCVIYSPEFDEEVAREMLLKRALQVANYGDEFHLVFQPIVGAKNSDIAAVEALLRWNSPELGSVRPDLFIPVAERLGEIHDIGRWVIAKTCEQLSSWIADGLAPGITVSVNVSPHQLADPDFVPFVLTTLSEWSVPPTRLTVEVTESVAVENTELASSRLGELRDAGVRVSIDDFGDGFSNLGQLLQVPFDTIKVDRSLLLMLGEMRASMGGDPTTPCSIMQAIVAIASATGASVVAEGVETKEQLTSLERSGVTYVQGYFTGRPQAADELTQVLLESSRPPAAIAS